SFPVPSRGSLPGLPRSASLVRDGRRVPAGYVEASRGCLHTCLHCPIPPVYGGRFFAVPRDVVLEDVRRLVVAGAGHITFGDPDFLNGPGHAVRLVRAMHAEFPALSYDFTAKIEHTVRHPPLPWAPRRRRLHLSLDASRPAHGRAAARRERARGAGGSLGRGSRRDVRSNPGARERPDRPGRGAHVVPRPTARPSHCGTADRAVVLLSRTHREPVGL